MADNMRLYLELMGKSGNLRSELNSSRGAVTRFTSGVKKEFAALRNLAGSVSGQLAALGVGFSAVRIAGDSARLDKGLTRIKQTAGESAREVAILRKELFTMSRQTGKPIEDLQAGFDNLVQSGLNWKSALESIKAVNIGSGVTGAQPGTLSGGLTVGATAFNFDLSKPGLALELLDKMTVAGRKGNAELESLSDIFARVGVNAASAGMNFDQTLAFIEGLSLIERNPERLATLADSTLRLFTNLKYMKDAQKATGVRFFDSKGERRESMDVIADIKKRYDTLKTDQQRAMFIQKAFGQADLDTQKGLKTFLQGDALAKVLLFTQEIGGAAGTLKRDLGDATGNLVDQVSMLKNDLREAADNFVKPMNETLSSWIKWARESKEKGGAGLDGEAMVKYGLGGMVGLGLLGRYGGKAIGGAASRLFSTGAGVGAGKVLEYGAGVTPVFVVNMPGAGLLAGAGAGVAAGAGATAVLKSTATKMGPLISRAIPWLAGIGAAGAGGYAIGTGLNQGAGKISGLLSGDKYGGEGWLGNLLYDLLERDRETKNEIKMNISIDRNDRVTSSSDDPNTSTTIKTMRRGSFAITPMASH